MDNLPFSLLKVCQRQQSLYVGSYQRKTIHSNCNIDRVAIGSQEMSSLLQDSVANYCAFLANYRLVPRLPVSVFLSLSSLTPAKLSLLSALPSTEHRECPHLANAYLNFGALSIGRWWARDSGPKMAMCA